MKKILILLAALIIGLTGISHASTPTTIRYDYLNSFVSPTFDYLGVTVTGSNQIHVQYGNGLGIWGGIGGSLIGINEWAFFHFDSGAASDVSYFVNSASSSGSGQYPQGQHIIEAFGFSGNSLGTVMTDYVGNKSVSALFGGQTISGFKVAGTDITEQNTFRIRSVTYNEAPIAPEPVSLVLFIVGGIVMCGRRFLSGGNNA